ncbi:MAG: thioesterase family protein [Chromatocurvus sp.]
MNESQAFIVMHSETIKVRFRDTDAQGHLYFANYLVYADEAAGAFMSTLGFNWVDPQQAPCLVFTANINCDYLQECRMDDLVRVDVGYQRLGNTSAALGFAMHEEKSATPLARGTITQVFTDRQTRRPCPIPETLRQRLIAAAPALA